MRIIDFNFADETNGVTVTGSSQQASFPANNLGKQSPSRVWRSSGTFVIDATNNKIDFLETGGGPEITATLNFGSYTPSELET